MRYSLQAATAVAAWSAIVAAGDVPGAPDWLGGRCPQSKELSGFVKKLSPEALIYFPGSDGFEVASTRWSNLETPTVDMVVSPGSEQDVSQTVRDHHHYLHQLTQPH